MAMLPMIHHDTKPSVTGGRDDPTTAQDLGPSPSSSLVWASGTDAADQLHMSFLPLGRSHHQLHELYYAESAPPPSDPSPWESIAARTDHLNESAAVAEPQLERISSKKRRGLFRRRGGGAVQSQEDAATSGTFMSPLDPAASSSQLHDPSTAPATGTEHDDVTKPANVAHARDGNSQTSLPAESPSLLERKSSRKRGGYFNWRSAGATCTQQHMETATSSAPQLDNDERPDKDWQLNADLWQAEPSITAQAAGAEFSASDTIHQAQDSPRESLKRRSWWPGGGGGGAAQLEMTVAPSQCARPVPWANDGPVRLGTNNQASVAAPTQSSWRWLRWGVKAGKEAAQEQAFSDAKDPTDGAQHRGQADSGARVPNDPDSAVDSTAVVTVEDSKDMAALYQLAMMAPADKSRALQVLEQARQLLSPQHLALILRWLLPFALEVTSRFLSDHALEIVLGLAVGAPVAVVLPPLLPGVVLGLAGAKLAFRYRREIMTVAVASWRVTASYMRSIATAYRWWRRGEQDDDAYRALIDASQCRLLEARKMKMEVAQLEQPECTGTLPVVLRRRNSL